ncbi:FYVE, RhoGEF and PH domain-containing protein 4-like [Heterodontus francisci]|uniref:FYVE, RhoGEF and PH domain-containing protein 4-like n=1 Tax=Heterodontus francisci TaxID=7792 RepID=UPI00355BFC2C
METEMEVEEQLNTVSQLINCFEKWRPHVERNEFSGLPTSPVEKDSKSSFQLQIEPSKQARWRKISRTFRPITQVQRSPPPTAESNQMDNVSQKETDEEKMFKIARELLQTEEAYVKRLHLVDQVFYAELLKEANSGNSFSEDAVKKIFSNISSIYLFHKQFFLPELQQCVQEWNVNPRIGNVLYKLAPFLKMYGEYVKHFDKAMDLLDTLLQKCQPFRDIIEHIQAQAVCSSLTLQHHMLEPVQRIPRYQLLLMDYLRKLPPDSADRTNAEKSLQIIAEAAKHSNAAIAELEKQEKMWEIFEMLGGDPDLLDPSSELVKEGPILKVSVRSNTANERHLFLLNNMLLYCSPKLSLGGSRFTVRTKLLMDSMQVKEVIDAEGRHCFLVSGKQRLLELQARSHDELEAWIQAIQETVDLYKSKMESFRCAAVSSNPQVQDQVGELGLRAPHWVRDNHVTMCMCCKEAFNFITRRRHHCRACGHVVCWKCSDYKAKLHYDGDRLNRVCQECYNVLNGEPCTEEKERKRGILEKESAYVSGNSLMCSFLHWVEKAGKLGLKAWFVIPRDEPFVLYMYRAPQDVKAQSSIPLPGYTVNQLSASDAGYSFQLIQSKQVYTFSAETEELRARWVHLLNQLVIGLSPGVEDVYDLSE